MDILTTSNLTKSYGAKRAVNEVNMRVKQGDIYGFVGLNGAGKTTLIRMICGLSKKSGGGFTLLGKDDSRPLEAERAKISYMVETPALYLNMTGEDNLKMQCYLQKMPFERIAELLRLVGLANVNKKQTVKNYSLGMKQRLAIASALIGDPQFLLLDEPTNGLDPEGIIEVRELLKSLNRDRGITILISSHILSELGRLATTYGFIHNGRLIREITAEEIASSYGRRMNITVDAFDAAYAKLSSVCDVQTDGKTLSVKADFSADKLFRLLDECGVKIQTFTTTSGDLEEYFMQLIGGRLS